MWITGTSRGIGRQIASLLHARGDWRVVGSCRSGDDEAPWPTVSLDTSRPESIRDALKTVESRFGRIDALINNAGVGRIASLEETTTAEWMELMSVNFLGSVELIRAVAPQMRAQRSGRIVQISSLAAHTAMPFGSAYAASKAAIEAACATVRLELLPYNVFMSIVVLPAVSSTTEGVSIRLPQSPLRAYDQARRAWISLLQKIATQSGIPAAKVAHVVAKLLEIDRPHLRYPVGAQATFMLKLAPLVPQSLLEGLLLRTFRLGPATQAPE